MLLAVLSTSRSRQPVKVFNANLFNLASFCKIFIAILDSFLGAGVSNFLVRVSNPNFFVRKEVSAARGRKVKDLAQLIKHVYDSMKKHSSETQSENNIICFKSINL